MKLSRKWLHEDYFDLSLISDEDFAARMTAFGHHVKVTHTKDDTVFEFEAPAHRTDCRSVIGLVREIGAAFQIPFCLHEPEVIGTEQASIFEMLDADIWAEHLCNRFSCRIAVNATVCPSPAWMQKRLTVCGIALVNNIIDAANYTALEYGQEITVLDYASITSGNLWIRESMPGEDLPANTAVLCDSMNPLISGNSVICPDVEISKNTTSIVIIAANYNPFSDPMLTVPALQRFCQLVEQQNWGQIADGTIDLLNYVPQPKYLPFDADAIAKQLETPLSEAEIEQYLSSVGISVTEQELHIPSYRIDLENIEDIAKEICRITTVRSF